MKHRPSISPSVQWPTLDPYNFEEGTDKWINRQTNDLRQRCDDLLILLQSYNLVTGHYQKRSYFLYISLGNQLRWMTCYVIVLDCIFFRIYVLLIHTMHCASAFQDCQIWWRSVQKVGNGLEGISWLNHVNGRHFQRDCISNGQRQIVSLRQPWELSR